MTAQTKCDVQPLPALVLRGSAPDPWKQCPQWAIDLVKKECKVPTITLVWHKCNRRSSTGRAYQCFYKSFYGEQIRIGMTLTMSAGWDDVSAKQILLHEIAHFNVGIKEKHSEKFIKEVIRLYRKHNLLEAVANGDLYEYPTVAKAALKSWNRTAGATR